MANQVLHFLILIIFFGALCNAHDKEFLKCMSQRSLANTNTYIFPPNSPKYSKSLIYAQKNGRWMNTTATHPIFIVAPCIEAEVQSIIHCSKEVGLEIRIKSGGHDFEGLSFRTKTAFIMLDMNNLNSIDINLKEETAWMQAGASLGKLYYQLYKQTNSLAFTGGSYRTMAAGGHISGGGVGTMVRKYGIAADNVLDARIVNADGQILDRSSMGEDLFWAIRGGGGASFGVILAWKLKLSPVPNEVTAFIVRRKMTPETIKLIRRYESICYNLPEDLFLRLRLQNANQNVTGEEKIVQISFQGLFLGKADDLIPLLNQNFPEFKLESKDCFQGQYAADPKCIEKPCIVKECYQVPWIRSVLFFVGHTNEDLEYLAAEDFAKPPNYFKAKSDFANKPIPTAGWKMIQKSFLEEESSPTIIIDPFGGKMSQISESDIPFPHRKGTIYNIQYLVTWKADEPEFQVNKHMEWIRKLYKNMEPFVASNPRGAYINYKDLDLGANNEAYNYDHAKVWGEKYYKGNFERLAKVKSQVDPQNFFRNELSIPLFK